MFKKIINRSLMIYRNLRIKKKVCGVRCTIGALFWWIGWYCRPLKKLAFKGLDIQRDAYDKLWLEKYSHIVHKYSKLSMPEQQMADCEYKIWVFWAQGVENAPELIKSCVSSIKKHNPERVVCLSMKNVREYIDIPEHIYQKLESEKISYTNYADILRVSLLGRYGGLWLDPTCFCIREVPAETRNRAFFSPKDEWKGYLPLWSKSRWGTYALGTNRINNPVLLFVQDIFYEYLEDNNELLDYWMIDILLDFFSRNNTSFCQELENNVIDTTSRTSLYKVLGYKYNESLYQSMAKNTWFFKLSYKKDFVKVIDGCKSFYGVVTAE